MASCAQGTAPAWCTQHIISFHPLKIGWNFTTSSVVGLEVQEMPFFKALSEEAEFAIAELLIAFVR